MASSQVPLHHSRESQVALARHQMRAAIPSEGKAKTAATRRKIASSACRMPTWRRGGGERDDFEDMGASSFHCLLLYGSGARVSKEYTFTRACSSVGKRSRASSTARRVCSVTKYQIVE